MKTHSLNDVEQLSAFLDNQLSKVEKSRLEVRLKEDHELSSTLAELRQTRVILHRAPQHKIPHDFRLTSKMIGIKPPMPTLVPVFSWGSALAMLLFLFTLGVNTLGRMTPVSQAPMMAAAPRNSEGYGVGGGPAVTQPPLEDNNQVFATPKNLASGSPEGTPQPEAPLAAPVSAPTLKTTSQGFNFWLVLWSGLAIVFLAIALIIRWTTIRTFQQNRKNK